MVQHLLDQGNSSSSSSSSEAEKSTTEENHQGGKKELEARDEQGMTSLMRACLRGDLDEARSLIERGVKINARNKKAQTALMMACKEETRKWSDFSSRLIKSNSISGTPVSGQPCILLVSKATLRSSSSSSSKGRHKRLGPKKETPLMAACRHGHLEIVKQLVLSWSQHQLS